MNVVEAIKSGKRFKRKGWSDTGWMEPTGSFGFTVESMIADDWQVEDVSVTITLDEFACAFAAALASFKKMELTMTDFYLKLTKELGL